MAGRTLSLAEPIYEFGSFLVPEQLATADLRPLFPGKVYVGCDMREGPGVDRILNLHDIDLPDGTAGTVLCLDTLEHVEYPHQAMAEIYRILRPDGIVLISSVMNYPIHDYPCDYWRFTPEAFRSLLKPFHRVFVQCAGQELFPHTVVGIGCKGDCTGLDRLADLSEIWRLQWTEPEPPRDLKGKLLRELKRVVRQITGRHGRS